MVAIIKTGHSIRRTFHYNENKVNEGVAQLLLAQNYPMEQLAMTASHRLNMLLKTAERNANVSRNSVHISLNFAPGETLDSENLKAIATEYMEAIGFGSQPYLVYQHHDAAHPHIHIATTLIDQKGKAIRMQNIGKTKSETARKDIEQRYGLVSAEQHKKSLFRLPPLNVEKIVYGKTETRRAIANILTNLLEKYKYTSLTELNSLLKLYNLEAYIGSETSRLLQYNGLLYRLLNKDGQPVGIPIKASLFHNRPTLTYLEKQFLLNHAARKPHTDRIKNAVELALKNQKTSTIQQLSVKLKKAGIDVIARHNSEGRMYGITYVDHFTKCVFNGSTLGKQYSANAIHAHLTAARSKDLHAEKPIEQVPFTSFETSTEIKTPELLSILLEPEYSSEQVPFPLRPKRKKKKKRNNNNPNQAQ